jgi:hypothetical protein
MRLPQISVLRSLVGIGVISIWLWLFRTNARWTFWGSLVLALSVYAADRRSRLATELKFPEERGRTLALAGVVGYSIAVFLGLAWVISILVWDSFQPGLR